MWWFWSQIVSDGELMLIVTISIIAVVIAIRRKIATKTVPETWKSGSWEPIHCGRAFNFFFLKLCGRRNRLLIEKSGANIVGTHLLLCYIDNMSACFPWFWPFSIAKAHQPTSPSQLQTFMERIFLEFPSYTLERTYKFHDDYIATRLPVFLMVEDYCKELIQ